MSRLGVNSVVKDFKIEKFLGKGSYGYGSYGLAASLPARAIAPHPCPRLTHVPLGTGRSTASSAKQMGVLMP